jgi:hypothetical protein
MARLLTRPQPGSTLECLVDYLIEQTISGGGSAAIVAALQALQDNELTKVYDSTGVIFGVRAVFDEDSGALISWTYYNADGTVGVPVGAVTWAFSTQRVPSKIITSAAGSVAAGARSVSVWNKGGVVGLVLGSAIDPGEQNTWSAPDGDTLGAISYDGTATVLVITVVV